MFFIGIFGIEDKIKELKSFHNVVCPACGRYSAARLICSFTFFHFFFIPLFRWNKAWFVRMDCCSAMYTCGKEEADEMLETATIDFSKCSRMQHQSTAGYCPCCGSRVAGGFKYCPYCGEKL